MGRVSLCYRPVLSMITQPGWMIKTVMWQLVSLTLITASGLCKEIGFTAFGLLVLLEGYFVLGVSRGLAAKQRGSGG